MLKNKTALITGASRGIGRAIALLYAEQGCDIAFTYLNEDQEANNLLDILHDKGVKALSFKGDAADFNFAHQVVNQVIDNFGKLDILVCNAGITQDALLIRMSEQQWDMVINVNLKSAFNLTHAVQKHMLRQRSGSIINMSSVVGVSGNAGQSNYSASKAGMIGFTKSVAQELGSRNIRCNAIAPGFIITDMTGQLSDEVRKGWEQKIPLRRGGTPDEVAKAALFLASDLSSYVSGQVINVCGAMNT